MASGNENPFGWQAVIGSLPKAVIFSILMILPLYLAVQRWGEEAVGPWATPYAIVALVIYTIICYRLLESKKGAKKKCPEQTVMEKNGPGSNG